MATKKLKFFRMETDAQGITVVTFDRPPGQRGLLRRLPRHPGDGETIESTDQTRVVVLTAPPGNSGPGAAAPTCVTSSRSTTRAAWRATR